MTTIIPVVTLSTLFWLLAFGLLLRGRKQPLFTISTAFLFGALAVVPVFIVQIIPSVILSFFLGPSAAEAVPYLFFRLGVLAPATEEVFKFLAARLPVTKAVQFNTAADALVYSAAAAIGFSVTENVVRLLDCFITGTGPDVPLLIMRSAICVPSHVLWSAWSGIAWGRSKIAPESAGASIPKGLLIACLLHAVFNLILWASELLLPKHDYNLTITAIAYIPIVAYLLIVAFFYVRMIRSASA